MSTAGPPGWAAAAVMIAFEVIALVLDLTDVDGYGSFVDKDSIEALTRQIDFGSWEGAKSVGDDYPYLWPMDGDLGYLQNPRDVKKAKETGDTSKLYYTNACNTCLLYTSPSPRDQRGSRMPSSA